MTTNYKMLLEHERRRRENEMIEVGKDAPGFRIAGTQPEPDFCVHNTNKQTSIQYAHHRRSDCIDFIHFSFASLGGVYYLSNS